MGRGNDRDGLFGDVDSVAQAGLIDVWKAIDNERGRFVGDIQKNMVGSRFFHLRVNRAGHDIARSQGLHGMIGFHEWKAIQVFEDASFSPQGLRDEEGFRLWVEKAGWVELNEFHVRDGNPGSCRHGDAVAGGDVRIGGIQVNLTATASGEDDKRRPDGFNFPRQNIEHIGAQAVGFTREGCFFRGDQIDGKVILQHFNVGILCNGSEKRLLNHFASHVLAVKNASFGVAAFFAEVPLSGAA